MGQIRVVQRRPLVVFVDSQTPPGQNNSYATAVYAGLLHCVPVKLYLKKKQVVGWFWPAGCSLLTPDGRAWCVGQRKILFTSTRIQI